MLKERNAFFASVFSRELARWQKETGKTTTQFAELIDVHKNIISRYKKGDVFPSKHTMALICGTLNVENTIFYPQSAEDMFKYDPEFRDHFLDYAIEKMHKDVKKTGIDTSFYFFCVNMEGFADVFPFSDAPSNDDDPLAFSINHGIPIKFNRDDLEFIKSLQAKAEEYIMALVTKAKYDKEHTQSQSVTATNTE